MRLATLLACLLALSGCSTTQGPDPRVANLSDRTHALEVSYEELRQAIASHRIQIEALKQSGSRR